MNALVSSWHASRRCGGNPARSRWLPVLSGWALALAGCAHVPAVPATEKQGPEVELSLYAVPGLSVASEDTGALIQPAFRALLDDTERGYFRAHFAPLFPSSVATIDDSNKRRTLAVSLQLGRASYFGAPKPGGAEVDVYVPVTASLYLTNVLTGEVQYSRTVTHIQTQTLPTTLAAAGTTEVGALFLSGYRAAIDDLVHALKTGFHPRASCGTVRRAWQGLAILDAGLARGLAEDDAITDENGDELRVLHAGESYAVARVELGHFETGAHFCRLSSRSAADTRKPSVLPVIEQSPDWMPPETLAQLAADLIGDKTAVHLVSLNQTYAYVRQTLAQNVALSQAELHHRVLPGLFLRLSVLEPLTYETPTVLPHKQLRITEATVLAELVDRSRRVVYATQGRDRVEDEIILGTAIDLDGRREIAVKNALLDLAQRMGKEFKLRSVSLPITRGGEHLLIRDENGLLQAGGRARAFHSLGHIAHIEEEVWVPTWELAVAGSSAGLTEAKASLHLADGVPAPSRSDRVIVSSAGISQAGMHRLAACGSTERFGELDVPDFAALALNALASTSGAPYFIRGLGPRLARTLRADASFAGPLDLTEPAVDRCVEPVQRIDPLSPVCGEDEVCSDRAQVGVTLRLRQGAARTDAIVARPGLKSMLRARTLRVGTSAEARSTALAADLISEVLKLGRQLAPEVTKQAL